LFRDDRKSWFAPRNEEELMPSQKYYVEAEDEPAPQPEVLTPNQLRDIEEHKRAVERWGRMPDGDPGAIPSAGHMITFLDGTQDGRFKWLDMGCGGNLHCRKCKVCGNKFFGKSRVAKICSACIKPSVKSEGRKNGIVDTDGPGRSDADVRAVLPAGARASSGDIRRHGDGENNVSKCRSEAGVLI
jgi:hypothetical protein